MFPPKDVFKLRTNIPRQLWKINKILYFRNLMWRRWKKTSWQAIQLLIKTRVDYVLLRASDKSCYVVIEFYHDEVSYHSEAWISTFINGKVKFRERTRILASDCWGPMEAVSLKQAELDWATDTYVWLASSIRSEPFSHRHRSSCQLHSCFPSNCCFSCLFSRLPISQQNHYS